MQLVAYGAQDVYLSGNPQITFFKVVYRRHTNFSVEPIQQTWNGAADFGRTVTCNINRNGDLITNMYIVVSLSAVKSNTSLSSEKGVNAPANSWGYVKRLGHALINWCKIEIGGSQIDQHYGDWLNIWYELTHKVGQERGYSQMIGDVPALTNVDSNGKPAYTLYIPLQFWFNRNNGLALPLIALQYHDVRVTVMFRNITECINYRGKVVPSLPGLMSDSSLVIDYIYLDAEERKRFAQASHEYLIEQLQFTGSETITSNSNNFRLNFNHPCKYLVWAPQLDRYSTPQQWISYAFDGNWQNTLDQFAKLLWLSSQNNLVFTNQSGVNTAGLPTAVSGSPASVSSILDIKTFNVNAYGCAIGLNHSLASASGVYTVGDLSDGFYSSKLDSTISKLLTKIQVKGVITDIIVGSTTGSSLSAPGGFIYCANSTNTTPPSMETLLNNVLNNIIVVNNSLTISDISKNLNQLLALFPSSSLGYAPAAVLDAASLTVVNWCNYGNNLDGSDNPVTTSKLQLNGHDRFQARDGSYFNYVQPYQHFSNTPADGINIYSFSLKPEDHQPSGSCNFSRIDNATLNLMYGTRNANSTTWFTDYAGSNGSLVNIYTMNYNVLRVMSGMAGTAYSN